MQKSVLFFHFQLNFLLLLCKTAHIINLIILSYDQVSIPPEFRDTFNDFFLRR